jgi:hypothetical protein
MLPILYPRIETWKDVPGYEGLYQASTLGRIRRHETKRVIKTPKNSNGYCQLNLHVRGHRTHVLAHRVVAATFIGPCPAGKEINHIDTVRQNNRIHNLEYVTPKENTAHATKLGRRWYNWGEKVGTSRLKINEVLTIRQLKESGIFTGRQQCFIFGIAKSTYDHVVARKTWTHI